MPPDITSIDSDISKWFSHKCNFLLSFSDKISALTPFSDQFMPNVTTAGGSEQHFM